MANHKEKLFNEFPPVSTERWEEVIKKDLKGADYGKKLVWRTLEGLKINPYFRREDLQGKEYLDTLPGEYPYTRGNTANTNDWEIRQDIEAGDLQEANKEALFILDRGVTSLGFNVNCESGSCILKSEADVEALLKDVYINCIGVYFNSWHNSPEIIKYLAGVITQRGIDKSEVKGAVSYDPLGCLTIKGTWAEDENTDFFVLKDTIQYTEENLPVYRAFSVNGQHFNNAGASVVQELGYSLAMTAEYFTRLMDAGLSADVISRHLQVNFGVGTNYFMEIAKIRAARFLFAKLLDAYGAENKKIHIGSITSNWNATIYDPYVNVLRATTEAMAAVIGGTNSLVVKPFDTSFKKQNRFSDRIARNIQIILKEESYFDKIVDPSSGSYYIENITDSVIEEAWKLFLEIDSKGGYLQALKDGVVQEGLEETAAKRTKNVATRREVLLGTNQFPNTGEMVKEDIEAEAIDRQVETKGGTVRPIRKFRGAEGFEALRLATENSGKKPKAFMLTIGNLAFRKARATFSCNFFGCAGYEVVDNLGFKSAEEGVKAAVEANANIVVVCSSDDEYAEVVPQVQEHLGEQAILVVAGAPACMDELKAKGIEHFIHVRSNVLETLQGFNKLLGIE